MDTEDTDAAPLCTLARKPVKRKKAGNIKEYMKPATSPLALSQPLQDISVPTSKNLS